MYMYIYMYKCVGISCIYSYYFTYGNSCVLNYRLPYFSSTYMYMCMHVHYPSYRLMS